MLAAIGAEQLAPVAGLITVVVQPLPTAFFRYVTEIIRGTMPGQHQVLITSQSVQLNVFYGYVPCYTTIQ